jgi:hypothetical protein
MAGPGGADHFLSRLSGATRPIRFLPQAWPVGQIACHRVFARFSSRQAAPITIADEALFLETVITPPPSNPPTIARLKAMGVEGVFSAVPRLQAV